MPADIIPLGEHRDLKAEKNLEQRFRDTNFQYLAAVAEIIKTREILIQRVYDLLPVKPSVVDDSALKETPKGLETAQIYSLNSRVTPVNPLTQILRMISLWDENIHQSMDPKLRLPSEDLGPDENRMKHLLVLVDQCSASEIEELAKYLSSVNIAHASRTVIVQKAHLHILISQKREQFQKLNNDQQR